MYLHKTCTDFLGANLATSRLTWEIDKREMGKTEKGKTRLCNDLNLGMRGPDKRLFTRQVQSYHCGMCQDTEAERLCMGVSCVSCM